MADHSHLKKVIKIGLIIVLVIAAIYFIFVRSWILRMGAADAELKMSMPGDEMVKKPALLDNSNKQVDGAPC